MRVALYGAATNTEAATQTNKASASGTLASQKAINSPSSTTEDTTSLTSNSGSVQSLTQAALQPIPSRAAKVEALKQAVGSGQYQLDASKIADSLANSDI